MKLCGVCPISRTTLRGERDADGMAFSHYSRNANKLEGEPGGAPTRFTGMLTSIDADALKATYTIQGDARGSYVMDGRNMTEKVDRTSRAGQFKRCVAVLEPFRREAASTPFCVPVRRDAVTSRKVSDEVKNIQICGCCPLD